jgi:hypothetical protein
VHETREGRGSLRIGEVVSAEMEPFRGPDGTIHHPAGLAVLDRPRLARRCGPASHHRVDLPRHGMVWSFEGRNAIQSDYRITHTVEP